MTTIECPNGNPYHDLIKAVINLMTTIQDLERKDASEPAWYGAFSTYEDCPLGPPPNGNLGYGIAVEWPDLKLMFDNVKKELDDGFDYPIRKVWFEDEGYLPTVELAERIDESFSLADCEEELCKAHGVSEYDDVPESSRCRFVDEMESEAIQIILDAGYTLIDHMGISTYK